MRLDALEEIMKARKPKGLAGWKKLEGVQEKLANKQASHITFTTSYPGQEGSKKYLGSASGNLHFLLGYANPAFHVAPYHWQVVDPNMTDEEARSRPHPTNPRYWQAAGLPMQDEGDLDEGKPHKSANSMRGAQAQRSQKKAGAMMAQSGYGKYVALPSEGKVFSLTNGHIYDWRIVRESYFASTNPEISEAMDAVYEEGPGEVEKSVLASIGSELRPFSPNVYPLVKSLFPKPGSVLTLEKGYAVVGSSIMYFFDWSGNPATAEVFDRKYEYFDLQKGGDIHPTILLNFAVKYLGLNKDSLTAFVHKD